MPEYDGKTLGPGDDEATRRGGFGKTTGAKAGSRRPVCGSIVFYFFLADLVAGRDLVS